MKINLRPHGTKVFVNLDDKTFLEIDWRSADELATALRACARKCEEQEKAEQIAKDAGLLLRAGVPIGLTSDPRIQDAAASIAAWDRDLRRALPGGVKSEEHVGAPTIIRGTAPLNRH